MGVTQQALATSIDWRVRDTDGDQAIRAGGRTVIDDARWRAVLQRVPVGTGLQVVLADIEARRDLTVELPEDGWPQSITGLVAVSGRASVDFLDGAVAHVGLDRALLFRGSGNGVACRLASGVRFRATVYGLSATCVRRLFDGDVPSALRPLLGPAPGASRIVEMRGTRRMRALAAETFADRLDDRLRILMWKGRVIQLLAVQAAAAEACLAPKPARDLSARDRAVLGRVRARLLANVRRPPTLGELARAAGLPETVLNSRFRAQFGATVSEALRAERLDRARLAIEAGVLSTKEIAFRVGYNHVTNFTNAFTRRFGIPPRQYAHRMASRGGCGWSEAEEQESAGVSC